VRTFCAVRRLGQMDLVWRLVLIDHDQTATYEQAEGHMDRRLEAKERRSVV